MARSGLVLVASVLSYIVLIYLIPGPVNIVVAPIAAGALASLAAGGRALYSLLLGSLVGVVSYIAAVAIAGGLPTVIIVAVDLAGPVGVVAPLLYHGLGTGLISLVITGVRGR